MKLYDLELSGNSYRVRLLLSLLGLKHEVVTVNLMNGENREPWFLKLNPRGQFPRSMTVARWCGTPWPSSCISPANTAERSGSLLIRRAWPR